MGKRFLEHSSLKKRTSLGRLVHQEECVTSIRNFINRKNASLASLKFHHSCRLFWSFLHILETLNSKLHCCRGNYDLFFTFLKLWARSSIITNEIWVFSSCSWNFKLETPSLSVKFWSFLHVLETLNSKLPQHFETFSSKLHCCNWNFNLLFIFLKFWAWSSIIASEILVFFSHFWNFSYVLHFKNVFLTSSSF